MLSIYVCMCVCIYIYICSIHFACIIMRMCHITRIDPDIHTRWKCILIKPANTHTQTHRQMASSCSPLASARRRTWWCWTSQTSLRWRRTCPSPPKRPSKFLFSFRQRCVTSFSLSLSLSLSLTLEPLRARARTHTHAHTHIYPNLWWRTCIRLWLPWEENH